MKKDYKVKITEISEMVVRVEAGSIGEAEEEVKNRWIEGDYILDASDFVDVRFDAQESECKPICENENDDRPETYIVEQIVVDVNNKRRIRLRQHEVDGAISVVTLSAPTDATGKRNVESEFEISAGDLVMMLNWFRFQKTNGNSDLKF